MELISWILFCTAIVASVVATLYLYFSVKFTYWKKRGVPHLEPSFPAGNIKDAMLSKKNLAEVYIDIYKKLSGNKFAGFYQFPSPVLLLIDPDLIKNFLVKDFEHFHDHGFHFDEELDPMGLNLFQLDGARWKELRNKLSPTFTSGKMKMMFPVLVDCGVELQECLQEPASRGEVLEMKDILARFSTDIIASCAFGIQCNCLKDPDAEFRHCGRQLFEPTFNQKIRDLLYLTMPSLAIFLRIANTPGHLTKFFIKVVEDTVNYRERNDIKRKDFMQLLIDLKNKGTVDDEGQGQGKITSKLTMTEVAAQAFTFFAAGFETSSTTMSFCLYELALNQDIQDRLRKEIDTVLKNHSGKVTYESIQEMGYLDKVMSETLRKHPPAAFLIRECTKEYKITDSDVTVEKGNQVVVPVMAMHYDPKYFPNPQKFDPERFSEEVKNKRHHYAYLPFGEGPRICIGMRFAQMQTKVGLVSLLSKYEFHVCSKTRIPLVYDPKSFILFMEGGNWLQIKKRSQ